MKANYRSILTSPFVVSCISAATLIACGGGGGGGGDAKVSTISGVAAYGAPLAGASITVMDATGKSANPATSAADGSYFVDVTGLTAPLLVKASGESGDAVREYLTLLTSTPAAGQTTTANVTPLTTALVSMASSDGASPGEFASADKLKALDSAKLAKALSNLQAALKDVLADAGLPANFDPTAATFKADRSSAADVLLDTIKVSVSDQGVSLTNVRVPVDETTDTAPTSTVTLKGTEAAPAALAKPAVASAALKGLDYLQTQINACLALAPDDRAALTATGEYTLKGACNQITGYAANYKAWGYTLSQLWGRRLFNNIPANSTLEPIEFLLFMNDGKKAMVRMASRSSNGGTVFFEVAEKGDDGTWKIVGNQRNYDAGVEVRMLRASDKSTNGLVIPSTFTSNADAGKNVGFFDYYESRLSFNFDQQGPNGGGVYAVRVKGAGLPDKGLVLTRSSSCGTQNNLVLYRNDGTLPPLPASNMSTPPASATSGSWTLDIANYGDRYKGTDFYNQRRGLNSTGAPSTNVGNRFSPKAVDMKTIPEFALYKWEVFTIASGTTPADTFTSRIVTRPLAASEGAKQPWANPSTAMLGYVNPTDTAKAAELTGADLSWNLPFASAYVHGESGSPLQRLSIGKRVSKLGDTSVTATAAQEADGNGTPCANTKLPAFTATTGYREIGLRQTTERGLVLSQFAYHAARAGN